MIRASCYFYLVLNKVLTTLNQPFPLFEIELGSKMIISLEEIRARNDLNRLDPPPPPVCVSFDTRYMSKRKPPYILIYRGVSILTYTGGQKWRIRGVSILIHTGCQNRCIPPGGGLIFMIPGISTPKVGLSL